MLLQELDIERELSESYFDSDADDDDLDDDDDVSPSLLCDGGSEELSGVPHLLAVAENPLVSLFKEDVEEGSSDNGLPPLPPLAQFVPARDRNVPAKANADVNEDEDEDDDDDDDDGDSPGEEKTRFNNCGRVRVGPQQLRWLSVCLSVRPCCFLLAVHSSCRLPNAVHGFLQQYYCVANSPGYPVLFQQ